MAEVSEARLKVWVYQELLGTLGNRKKNLLKDALDIKQENNELDSLERRIWSAMKLHNSRRRQRDFLKKELKAWEKRTAP
jgi:hypothetical protein